MLHAFKAELWGKAAPMKSACVYLVRAARNFTRREQVYALIEVPHGAAGLCREYEGASGRRGPRLGGFIAIDPGRCPGLG
jgi:hypothetical protein